MRHRHRHHHHDHHLFRGLRETWAQDLPFGVVIGLVLGLNLVLTWRIATATVGDRPGNPCLSVIA
jgi:hypothetical protein